MHHPDVVLEMIKEVQAGARDPKTLAGLASPKRLAQLLAQRYDQSPLRRIPAQSHAMQGQVVQPRGLAGKQALQGTTQVPQAAQVPTNLEIGVNATIDNGWTQILNPAIQAQLNQAAGQNAALLGQVTLSEAANRLGPGVSKSFVPPPDYAPERLEFGGLWDGQTSRATLRVIAPIEGDLAAALPAGTPFRIWRMRTFSGLPRVEQVTTTSRPYWVPSPALPGAGGPSQDTMMTTTGAPWVVSVRSGQDVEIELEFAPRFGATRVGEHTTTLRVSGKSAVWFIDVPVRGRFEGLALGVIGSMDATDQTYFFGSTPPCNGTPAPMIANGITLINIDRQPRAVTIVPEALPPGVTFSPVPVSLAPGEKKHVPLTFGFAGCSLHGTIYPVQLGVVYPGVKRTVEFRFEWHFPFYKWAVTSQDLGDCTYGWELTIRSDGGYFLWAQLFNRTLVWPQVSLDIGYYPTSPMPPSGFVLKAWTPLYKDKNTLSRLSRTGSVPYIAEHFLELIRKEPEIRAQCGH